MGKIIRTLGFIGVCISLIFVSCGSSNIKNNPLVRASQMENISVDNDSPLKGVDVLDWPSDALASVFSYCSYKFTMDGTETLPNWRIEHFDKAPKKSYKFIIPRTKSGYFDSVQYYPIEAYLFQEYQFISPDNLVLQIALVENELVATFGSEFSGCFAVGFDREVKFTAFYLTKNISVLEDMLVITFSNEDKINPVFKQLPTIVFKIPLDTISKDKNTEVEFFDVEISIDNKFHNTGFLHIKYYPSYKMAQSYYNVGGDLYYIEEFASEAKYSSLHEVIFP